MRARPLLIASALLMLAGVPLRAQDTPPETPPAPTETTSEEAKLVVGEITDLAERSFRIRPWNPNLPRRLQVIAGSETRYFRQQRGKRKELTSGELVMVLVERSTTATPKKTAEGETEAPASPSRAKAVLRLWQATGKEITPEDRAVSLSLLRGALGYLPGRANAVSERLEREYSKALGVVRSVEPLAVETALGTTRQFMADNNTLVVNHEAIQPEALKKGQTVVIRSLTGPTADGALQATVVAVCPEPRQTPKQKRRLILRERGRKKK